MKDYRNEASEIIRRRKEFNEGFAQSYDDKNVIIPLPDPNSSEVEEVSIAEFKEILNEIDFSQEEKNQYIIQLARQRLCALASYVLKYAAIDYFLTLSTSEDVSCFVEGSMDESKLSSSEIYDILITLLPSYADAIISQVEAESTDVVEELLVAFRNKDKHEFTRLLRQEKGDFYRIAIICKYIQNNDFKYWDIQTASNIGLIYSSKDIIRDIQWSQDSLEGQRMEFLQNYVDLVERKDAGDSIAHGALMSETEKLIYSSYIFCMKVFVEYTQSLNEEQLNLFKNLLQVPEFASWYDNAYNDCVNQVTEDKAQERQRKLSEDYEQIEDDSSPNETDGLFILPKDFWENSKYIDSSVPDQIKGLKVTELRERGVESFAKFVQELSDRGYIGRDVESQYKFVRAFTGRTPQANMRGAQFEKAVWKGELGDLLYTIKTFTYQEKGKYSSLPTLFELRDNVREQFEEMIQSSKHASYAKAKKDYALVLERLYDFIHNKR